MFTKVAEGGSNYAWKTECLAIAWILLVQPFWDIGKFGAKKYYADHHTANTIQLFVAQKEIFLVHSLEQVVAKGNSLQTTW